MVLKAAREKAGKTQAQVAKEANISERSYIYYEDGAREPRASTAVLIADAVGSTVEELFGEGSPTE